MENPKIRKLIDQLEDQLELETRELEHYDVFAVKRLETLHRLVHLSDDEIKLSYNINFFD